ncbi:LysR family transcriptional regulator [Pseudoalteromonas sp. NBT06-2]|uniref:LysR family transcriptional regulator n=1 Tax=Pseudoalteromonas sp. NBT06-2 TaxID=2025950 RepID=UPI000BA6893B|nr:LysR family transcriptional regulator [Pseudoalteromonas sp. NBT06-2]PAJ75290.1 LysR family transcriptional regulator [Pseudoalteromonas sp. NBT06-2]
MDIEALRSFLAFVETGSFTRAAKQVHRTQSAISMQMKKLEQNIDKSLFEKKGRLLVLSQDGQVFTGYARQLLQLHDETLNKMQTEVPSTLLRLGCPDDYAESVLPKVVKFLHQTWVNLDLQIVCTPSNRVKLMLDSGHLDIGITTRSTNSEEGYLLQSDRGIWIFNSNETAHLTIPLPIAVFQSDCRFHQAAIEGLLKQKRQFKLIACSGSASAQRGIVQQGLAIGAMAKLSKGNLDELSCDNLPQLPTIEIVLLRSSSKNNPISEEQLISLCESYRQTEITL